MTQVVLRLAWTRTPLLALSAAEGGVSSQQRFEGVVVLGKPVGVCPGSTVDCQVKVDSGKCFRPESREVTELKPQVHGRRFFNQQVNFKLPNMCIKVLWVCTSYGPAVSAYSFFFKSPFPPLLISGHKEMKMPPHIKFKTFKNIPQVSCCVRHFCTTARSVSASGAFCSVLLRCRY